MTHPKLLAIKRLFVVYPTAMKKSNNTTAVMLPKSIIERIEAATIPKGLSAQEFIEAILEEASKDAKNLVAEMWEG